MSYCRFSNGDVYMFPSTRGGIECCACRLTDKVMTIFSPGAGADLDEKQIAFRDAFGSVCDCENCCDKCMMFDNMVFDNYQDALDHLQVHRDAGHEVPDYAFEYLKEDMESNEPLNPLLCACGNVACVADLKTGECTCMNCVSEEADE